MENYPLFNLEEKDPSKVKAEFRFEKDDLLALSEVLRIPEVFRCKQGTVCAGMTGLCIILKRLAYPWNHALLSTENLQLYAESVARKGAALEDCFGFVDGTVGPICRPNKNQRIVYNGHKRVHSLKFQSVAIPNGMIASLYGPIGKIFRDDLKYFQFCV